MLDALASDAAARAPLRVARRVAPTLAALAWVRPVSRPFQPVLGTLDFDDTEAS